MMNYRTSKENISGIVVQVQVSIALRVFQIESINELRNSVTTRGRSENCLRAYQLIKLLVN
jgi:hypothetical protein